MKIPRKESLNKMCGYPSFEMSFFQKSGVIWSLGRYPCSVLGLGYRNQEKHFWALLIPKHKSSIKLGNYKSGGGETRCTEIRRPTVCHSDHGLGYEVPPNKILRETV